MLKHQFERFVEKVKKLHGDPHYIALGMGLGVFVAITPTIPFHTILVLILAFMFKASKAAAILGVWVSNPFTVVFLYVACYKAGFIFFEDTTGGIESIKLLIHHLEGDAHFSEKVSHFNGFIKTQLKVFLVMNVGGIILGVPSGVAAYVVTKRFFVKRKQRKKNRQKDRP